MRPGMRAMVVLLWALPLVWCLPAAPAAAARGETGAVVSVSAVSHGIRLTLSIAGLTYPRDALVRVRLTMRNVSPRTLWEAPLVMGYCEHRIADVVVLDAAGQPVNPIPPFPGPYPSCPAVPPTPLAPRQAVKQIDYVVLRAARMLAETNVNTAAGSSGFSGAVLKTRPLLLALKPGQSPRVVVRSSPGGTTAIVHRPPGAVGPLLYQQWSDCAPPVLSWTDAPASRVTAGCRVPAGDWHLVAGWLNHPVAILGGTPPDAGDGALGRRTAGHHHLNSARPAPAGRGILAPVGGYILYAVCRGSDLDIPQGAAGSRYSSDSRGCPRGSIALASRARV